MHNKLKILVDVMGDFFESLEQPVAIIDTEGKYVYYNQYDAEIDETGQKEALGKYILDIYDNLNENNSSMLRAVKFGERCIDQHQIYHTRSGRIVDYIHTTLPIYDGKMIIGAIEIGRDIGKIKELTNQVLDLSAKLYSHSDEHEQMESDVAGIITRNSTIKRILKELDLYASSDFPILVYGETGTGKELFVRRAHQKSARKSKPFISLNCAAIPETLIESILFGTTRGAFTGSENRKGLFEIADGGTLFLDELNSMPITTQAKLLRALQEGQIMKLGSTTPIYVDVRIIAAMNEPPEEAVKKAHLRQDLYYRLSVCLIFLPPLRERKDDISLLANYFVKKYAQELDRPLHLIHPSVLRQLEQNDWPGNIRMLENVIRRSIILEDPDHKALNQLHFNLDNSIANVTEEIFEKNDKQTFNNYKARCTGLSLTEMMEHYEHDIIENALKDTHGNVKQTAAILKIPRTTLQYKLKKYQLSELSNS